MRKTIVALFVAFGIGVAPLATPAMAVVSPGDPAPNFTKPELDFPSIGQTTDRTLADYSGKVIVFFLFGCL